ncbi:DEKNAAC101092 [Brettanomyces naardenensis]|uniref:DEKNAAC101092 n=1 Tax=Brettanomyces naardenensis TaxID=13370 RepID=A0A448YH81_BRENA|nr:DEKNAAC101092 [Brettanomyces naardenensis]
MNIGVNLPPLPPVKIEDDINPGDVRRGDWMGQMSSISNSSTAVINETIRQSGTEKKDTILGISKANLALMGTIVFYVLIVVMIVHYIYWGYQIVRERRRLRRSKYDVQTVEDPVSGVKGIILRRLRERNWTGGKLDQDLEAPQPEIVPFYEESTA